LNWNIWINIIKRNVMNTKIKLTILTIILGFSQLSAQTFEEFKKQRIQEYDYKYSNPFHAASNMLVDKGNYVIAGGDWNQNPVGFSMERFSNYDVRRIIEPEIEEDFMPEGWQWAFDPDIPTNRDVNQLYVKGKTATTIIDFFVVSPNISVLEIKTDDLNFEWADHQPVQMVFGFD